jgi:hypothetical protein
MMLASTTRTFLVPYTTRLVSTTPPESRGSIEQVPMMWYSVVHPALNHVSSADPVVSAEGYVWVIMYSFMGEAAASLRAHSSPAAVVSTEGMSEEVSKQAATKGSEKKD